MPATTITLLQGAAFLGPGTLLAAGADSASNGPIFVFVLILLGVANAIGVIAVTRGVLLKIYLGADAPRPTKGR
jgi:hypothetical protein